MRVRACFLGAEWNREAQAKQTRARRLPPYHLGQCGSVLVPCVALCWAPFYEAVAKIKGQLGLPRSDGFRTTGVGCF